MKVEDLHSGARRLAASLEAKAAAMRALETRDVLASVTERTAVSDCAWKARYGVELRARAAAAVADACRDELTRGRSAC